MIVNGWCYDLDKDGALRASRSSMSSLVAISPADTFSQNYIYIYIYIARKRKKCACQSLSSTSQASTGHSEYLHEILLLSIP